MDISVLGSVSASRNDAEVTLGPSVRRLLARLVVDHDHVVSSSRLIDAVWTSDPPDGAERSLKTYVSRLRQSIDPDREDRLVYREPGYVLSLEGVSLDSAAFEFDLDEAAQALRVVDPEQALSLLESALERWGGDPYGEFADEEWAQPEAIRLQERHIEARELMVEALLGAGETERAISAAKSLASSEPMHERPRELLMRALYISGRQPEALREFRTFRRMLVDEVGLDPSPALAELEGRIAARDASLDGAHRPLRGYELKERIGSGSFAVVHRAIQPGVGREVAIRIIRSPLADHPTFVRQFEHEARVIASVEHPHVVPLYDYWREPGSACLVMRLMRGGSVEDRLRAHGSLSDAATAGVLLDVGPALDAAHRSGVVHRDIRPANLLLDEGGAAYLGDFGIALSSSSQEGALATASGYASPEILRGESISSAADIYGLGVTVFEMVTGCLPYADSRDRAELIRQQLHEPLPSVCTVRADLPCALDNVLARATAKSPEHRHSTVGELVADLIEVLEPRRSSTSFDRVPPGLAENPYVGLQAFDEGHVAHFHGRHALVNDVVERLARQAFVVLVGPSGSGKSSVVRAGVLPAIRQGAVGGSEQWYATTMTPGSDPIDALEAALLRVAVNPPASLRSQLREPGGLLRAVRRVLPDDETTLLVVIDQFEELFTLTTVDEESERFLIELAAAIEAPSSPLRVLATLRADHYDGPLAAASFAGLVTDGTVTVRPLAPAELEEVIVRPAASVGVEVEPALVAELVAGVGERPSSLPLLQFALTELFRRRTSLLMSLSSYLEIGGLTGALAVRADEIVGAEGTPDWVEARRIFGRLVLIERSGAHSRRRALVTEFGERTHTAGLVEQLIAARLLTVDRDDASREPTLEVAHEALLRDWPTLRTWIADDREQLLVLHAIGERTEAWVLSGSDASELARGSRLAAAVELAQEHPDLLNPGELEWVEASVRQQQAEEQRRMAAAAKDRRQNRRLRSLLVAASLLLVVSVVAAAVAILLRSDAVDNERAAVAAGQEANSSAEAATEAQRESEENLAAAEQAERAAQQSEADAEIERLVALSAAQYDVAPDTAMLLALEANRRRDDAATRGAMQRSIATEPRLSRIIPRSGIGETLWLGESGAVAIEASNDGELTWIDLDTGQPTDVTYQTGGPVDGIRISDNGLVAVTDPNGDTTVLRVDGTDVVALAEYDGSVRDFGGDTLVLLQEDGSIFLDVRTDEITAKIPPGNLYVEMAAGGATAAIAYAPPDETGPQVFRTDVLDVATGTVTVSFPEEQFVAVMGLSADGLLVTGYLDGEIIVRDLTAPDPAESAVERLAHGREITAVGIAPDGRFATAGGDRSLRFWAADATQLGDSTRIAGFIGGLSVDANGRTVAWQDGGGLYVYEADSRRIVDRQLEDGMSVDRRSPWATSISEDGRGLELSSLDEPGVERRLDLSDTHPDAGISSWFPSRDGHRVLTWDDEIGPGTGGVWAVSALDGSASASWSEDNFDTLFEDLGIRDLQANLDEDGGRLHVAIVDEQHTWWGAWFDAETGSLIQGPTELPPGFPMLLGDGRLLHASPETDLAISFGDVDAEPDVFEGVRGFPLDHHPASGLVLIGGPNGVVQLIDPSSGAVTSLNGVAGLVRNGAFSPDGSLVAAVSVSEGVQLFDVETGQPLGVPMASAGQAAGGRPGIRWAADGSGVWITPSGGPVRFVTDPVKWREIACEIAGRELTAEEWRTLVSDTEPQVAACGR